MLIKIYSYIKLNDYKGKDLLENKINEWGYGWDVPDVQKNPSTNVKKKFGRLLKTVFNNLNNRTVFINCRYNFIFAVL